MSNIKEVVPLLKNKYVEISVGDEFEEMLYSESVKKKMGVIYGKVLDLLGDFVKVDCFYIDANAKDLNSGCIVFISSWQIKMITEINKGCLSDILLSVDDSRKVRKILGLE